MPSYVPDRGPDIARNGQSFLERRLMELQCELKDAAEGGEPWGRWRWARVEPAVNACAVALDQLQQVRIRALLRRIPKAERAEYWAMLGAWQHELNEAEGSDDAE
jgi:hypothetical protein